jgi:hypothetical protein
MQVALLPHLRKMSASCFFIGPYRGVDCKLRPLFPARKCYLTPFFLLPLNLSAMELRT